MPFGFYSLPKLFNLNLKNDPEKAIKSAIKLNFLGVKMASKSMLEQDVLSR